jgi:hypothetical protein
MAGRYSSIVVFAKFWTSTIKWFALLAVLFWLDQYTHRRPQFSQLTTIGTIGYFASAIAIIAAYCGGIAAARTLLRAERVRYALIAFGASTLLVGAANVLNLGFLVPTAEAAPSRDTSRQLSPTQLTLAQLPGAIREARIEWRRRGAAVDASDDTQLLTLREWRSRNFERQLAYGELTGLIWHLHFGIVWSLMPVITAWLGLVTGLWATHLRRHGARQLAYWCVACLAVVGTGNFYQSAMYSRYPPGALMHVAAWSAFAVPVVCLLVLGGSWLVMGRRMVVRPIESIG